MIDFEMDRTKHRPVISDQLEYSAMPLNCNEWDKYNEAIRGRPTGKQPGMPAWLVLLIIGAVMYLCGWLFSLWITLN